MAVRSTRQNLAIVLLALLLGVLTIWGGGLACGQSLQPSGDIAGGSPIPASLADVEPSRSLFGDSSRTRSMLTFCRGSGLDLPCRMESSAELCREAEGGCVTIDSPWIGSFACPAADFAAEVLVSPRACTDFWANGVGSYVQGDSPIFVDTKIGTVPSPPSNRDAVCVWPWATGEQWCVAAEPSSPPLLRWDGSRMDHLGDRLCELPAKVCCDYRSFYSCTGLRNLLLGIGAGAVLANTSLDQDFRDWYQERVTTDDVDRFARFWNCWGDGRIALPSMVAIGVVGTLFEDTPTGAVLTEFGARACRAYLVGLPPVAFGQWALGGARPGESDHGSSWQPFQASHAISGHAFLGAVPLITAAQMSDCIWVKGGLYGLSLLPAWARVNRDRHYLSQAFLGWWIACLSCSAVDKTIRSEKGYAVFPLLSPDMVGVGVTCPW